ncbi:hypothetical protein DFH06DRAFT_1123164 [Mycena polygramma]|nr:hypothetical protein DFH06DRAFT_1123164 [Mycena polygramma]
MHACYPAAVSFHERVGQSLNLLECQECGKHERHISIYDTAIPDYSSIGHPRSQYTSKIAGCDLGMDRWREGMAVALNRRVAGGRPEIETDEMIHQRGFEEPNVRFNTIQIEAALLQTPGYVG